MEQQQVTNMVLDILDNIYINIENKDVALGIINNIRQVLNEGGNSILISEIDTFIPEITNSENMKEMLAGDNIEQDSNEESIDENETYIKQYDQADLDMLRIDELTKKLEKLDRQLDNAKSSGEIAVLNREISKISREIDQLLGTEFNDYGDDEDIDESLIEDLDEDY